MGQQAHQLQNPGFGAYRVGSALSTPCHHFSYVRVKGHKLDVILPRHWVGNTLSSESVPCDRSFP